MKNPGIITLTTDFGLADPYVGMMKGVILSINPEARIVDISHQLNAGEISHAAGLVNETYRFFPKGTIHVVVVDPGVGGDRRPILIKTNDYFFIGPDNGLFWPIVSSYEDVGIIHLTEKMYFLPHISRTFHGRDLFSPVAAHLSLGIDPFKMGNAIADLVKLNLPVPQKNDEILSGQIIRIDNFGNMITNIRKQDIEQISDISDVVVKVGDLEINGMHEIYADEKEGEILALIGSSEHLEIAINLGRACDRLGGNSEKLIGMEVGVEKKQTNYC